MAINLKRRRIIVASLIIIAFLCHFVVEQRNLYEIYHLRDDFLNALMNRDFDEFDCMLTDTTRFVYQGHTYEELRDEIRENFETVEYTASKANILSASSTAGNEAFSTVYFEIIIMEDCFGKENYLTGYIEIQDWEGNYVIKEIACLSDDTDWEFGQRLFGEFKR